MSPVIIRPAQETDFDAIWSIFKTVVEGKDTYCDPANTTREEAYAKWMARDADTFVATYEGNVAGACLVRANRNGYGDHISNASFIVSPYYRGLSIGKRLGEYALAHAKSKGFLGMQFNFVVSTNTTAVRLWQSLGFAIIGTIPQGFRHGTLGLVDAYIMYRPL